MTKDKLFTIVRLVFAIAGATLLGRNLAGTVVNESWLQMAGGVALGLTATVWSFVDKTSTLESFQAGMMQLATFAGSLLLSSGIIDATKLQTWMGVVPLLVGVIYPILSKQKSKAIASGTLGVADLKGVNDPGDVVKPIVPVAQTPLSKTG